MVKEDLYAFKYGDPVSVYKLAEFTSANRLVKTILSELPEKQSLDGFAVCYWAAAGSIVLTGGRGSRSGITTETFLMAVQTGRWKKWWSIPELTVARYFHASMTKG